MAFLRIGTSGWSYAHWRERFYPKELRQSDWLGYYAGNFDTVEVNATFYRLPRPEYVTAWADAVPADFLFAVKGSRFLTHVKRLGDTGESLDRFIDLVGLLGGKAGPLLWQLPPSMDRDDDRLAAFAGALPADRRHVFEFRHPSWYCRDVYDILERAQAALCIADHPRMPKSLELTTSWTYLRFHQGGVDGRYSRKELEDWMALIREFQAGGIDVYAYFNNDPEGHAVVNANELRGMLVPA